VPIIGIKGVLKGVHRGYIGGTQVHYVQIVRSRHRVHWYTRMHFST
jgi:hypothetical protein